MDLSTVDFETLRMTFRAYRKTEAPGGKLFDTRTLKKPSGTEMPFAAYRIPTS